jgi:hypothetical protein
MTVYINPVLEPSINKRPFLGSFRTPNTQIFDIIVSHTEGQFTHKPRAVTMKL